MTSDGVLLKRVGGVLYDHPVRQALTAIRMVDGFRLTGDSVYLDRAIANAERLLVRATRSGPALFFPYPYTFRVHGLADEVLRAPWYSAMAQGQALTAFVRLFEATGDQRWRDAADATFESLKIVGPRTTPWVVHLDRSGYLWFEEYALARKPDRTINGHLFAVVGLYDYWLLTDDPEAKLLIEGGLTTVREQVATWRQPGWVSRYCITHRVQSTHYHTVHAQLAYDIHHMTGSAWWALLGDQLIADYPDDESIHGPVSFAAGTHVGFKFDKSGRIVATKAVTMTRPSGSSATARRRVYGRPGVYLQIQGGVFDGYLVQERSRLSYIRGIVYRIDWDPARTVTLRRGTYIGYDYGPNGVALGQRAMKINRTSSMRTGGRAIILGRLHYRIVGGTLDGLWLPATSGVELH
jgi:D-glucuronyl C5-epimerase C-terminus